MASETVKGDFEGQYSGWANGDTITGWITAPTQLGEDVMLEAHFDGAVIGRGFAKPPEGEHASRFEIKTNQLHRPIDIISSRLTVFASLPGKDRVQIWPKRELLNWLARIAFSNSLFEYLKDTEGTKFIVNMIELAHGRSAFGERRLEARGALPTDLERDLTPLLHQVGTICRDSSAILGRGGMIFVYEGGNKLYTQYQKTELSAAEEAHAAGWVAVFAERAKYFASTGIPFVQTIIPEKSTLLEHLYPLPVRTPTRLMVAVEDLAKEPEKGLGPKFVSILDGFRGHPDMNRLYMKTDSHFAARGAMAAMRLLLQSLAIQHDTLMQALPSIDALLEHAGKDSTPTKLLVGDLAMRFFDVPMYEQDLDVRYETLFDRASNLSLEQEFVPPGGRFNGLRMTWRHDNAPLNMRVVAFGNSYFSDGATCTQLSWWCKHLFQEFHFVWSKEVDRGYVEQVRPDAVICQTIERFLPALPRAFTDEAAQ